MNINNLLIVFSILLIVVAIIFAIFFSNKPGFEQSRFSVFFSVISSFSVLVIFVFYFILVRNQEIEKKLSFRELEDSEIISNSKDFVKLIFKSKDTIPKFIEAIYPELSYLPGTFEEKLKKFLISEFIFNTWQHFIFHQRLEGLDKEELKPKIASFISEFSGEEIRKYWNISYFKYSHETQEFAKLLFEYKPENYKAETILLEAEKLINDKRFLELLKPD
jgi:hypothetical protein